MIVEEFQTIREFKKKFPSKLFICTKCGNLTTNPHQCTSCGNQSNNFVYVENTYQYTILETGITEQIFKPIELEKGEQDGK